MKLQTLGIKQKSGASAAIAAKAPTKQQQKQKYRYGYTYNCSFNHHFLWPKCFPTSRKCPRNLNTPTADPHPPIPQVPYRTCCENISHLKILHCWCWDLRPVPSRELTFASENRTSQLEKDHLPTSHFSGVNSLFGFRECTSWLTKILHQFDMLMISTYTAFELISQLGVGIFIYCLYLLLSISKKHTILSLDPLIHTSKEQISYFRIT